MLILDSRENITLSMVKPIYIMQFALSTTKHPNQFDQLSVIICHQVHCFFYSMYQVCSSCSLRGSCEKAYLLTNKEDEARTMDVMRILLAYGFDPIDGSLANKSLLKMKPVKTVVRKLLHEVVKLSAVPIDPNLPPPVIKRPPPKVKQPPPPPKKRVGRDDIEMKKGDWLCPK